MKPWLHLSMYLVHVTFVSDCIVYTWWVLLLHKELLAISRYLEGQEKYIGCKTLWIEIMAVRFLVSYFQNRLYMWKFFFSQLKWIKVFENKRTNIKIPFLPPLQPQWTPLTAKTFHRQPIQYNIKHSILTSGLK